MECRTTESGAFQNLALERYNDGPQLSPVIPIKMAQKVTLISTVLKEG